MDTFRIVSSSREIYTRGNAPGKSGPRRGPTIAYFICLAIATPRPNADSSLHTLDVFRKRVDPLRILCLGAHSDDIEIGCGDSFCSCCVNTVR